MLYNPQIRRCNANCNRIPERLVESGVNQKNMTSGRPFHSMSKGRVKHLIGKPAPRWTVDDLISLATDQDIRAVNLLHVGSDGWLKTLDFVPRSETQLRDILEGGERADGSNLFAGSGIGPQGSDVVLRPRISTAFLNPFSHYPTLSLLCKHLAPDGSPLPASPDTILRKAVQRLQKTTGLDLWALGEVEYFLGKKPDEEDIYGSDDRGYHATAPFVFGEVLRRNAMSILSDIGVEVKYGHSEVGYIEANTEDDLIWEQHEIELALTPLLQAADAVVLTQWVLRNLAHGSRMRCSFDPIVRKGHAGSGLHFHFSPMRGGTAVSSLQEDQPLSDEAQWLIGGLLQMSSSLMAFGNRVGSSFIRLNQGKESPRSITWGRYNRNALIRLPLQARTEEGRIVTQPTIEYRLPDGSAHPYFILAAVVQAMLFGREIEDLNDLLSAAELTNTDKEQVEGTAIPSSFAEVARALEEQGHYYTEGDVFPEELLIHTREKLLSEPA